MTTEEKLIKIKKLADAMYTKMQYLTSDTSGIKKAMDNYHQFIVHEYHTEKPTSKDYRERYKRIAKSEEFKIAHEGMSIGEVMKVEGEESIDKALEKEIDNEVTKLHTAPCYDELANFARYFANWQKEQDEILQTLSYQEGLEDGIKIERQQIMGSAKGGVVEKDNQVILDDGTYIDLDPSMSLNPSFKVKEGQRIRALIMDED